jgi:large subunit ribosomal protein L35
MNKPIYRYLADRKWREYQYKIIVQRIKQLGIVPDLLPSFDPTAEVRLAFRGRNVQPGEFVDSRVSEVPARLNVQVFDKGERLVTIVVIDSDVPVVDTNNFKTQCHYLATNIPLSAVDTSIPLSKLKEEQLILTWLPPFAQKGSPYHRYSVFVLEQEPEQTMDVAELKTSIKRDRFFLKSFVAKQNLKPIGVGIFRSIWDEGTAGVMQRANIPGADVEFKRKRVIAIKPKQKPRGWEARHSGGKYLWAQRG